MDATYVGEERSPHASKALRTSPEYNCGVNGITLSAPTDLSPTSSVLKTNQQEGFLQLCHEQRKEAGNPLCENQADR
ncbi:V-type ATP synthase subunit E 3 [Frankliniella fusca]|uniref:V-type ATP synthase subunit E 3 n=1 Tax=Frankliniella fusca TaxID=407009 RepID=A0AAE1LL61_9NEOP|nr:V-type ATP synthase subunit E 3 [Frankliniella fusca]